MPFLFMIFHAFADAFSAAAFSLRCLLAATDAFADAAFLLRLRRRAAALFLPLR